jgi:hypothetical protein
MGTIITLVAITLANALLFPAIFRLKMRPGPYLKTNSLEKQMAPFNQDAHQ